MVVQNFEDTSCREHSIQGESFSTYLTDNWTEAAESTLPINPKPKTSVTLRGEHDGHEGSYLEAIEERSRRICDRVIQINVISLIVNLLLAIVALYLSFAKNSTSTTAFAADCILDSISCAIVLWRYYGDINIPNVHAREQIACIYLGALFLISALAIVVKSLSDLASGEDYVVEVANADSRSCELLYLAIVASVACSLITVLKCSLFKLLRDNSILIDVVNTLISTIFAMSIVMSQCLMNVDPTFWYLDPILSIVLAVFMALFGLRVIHQNSSVLKLEGMTCLSNSIGHINRPGSHTMFGVSNCQRDFSSYVRLNNELEQRNSNYMTNLNFSLEQSRRKEPAWQRSNYSSISGV